MEAIQEISKKFFLLRKRMRDNEIKDLSTKSNASFFNVFKKQQIKKASDTVKANQRFILENAKKTDQPEASSNLKAEIIPDHLLVSPTSSNKKKQEPKAKEKKKNTWNKIQRDDLINIAFNQNAPKMVIPNKKVEVSKQVLPVKKEEVLKEKEMDIGDQSPPIEKDSSSDSLFPTSMKPEKDEDNNDDVKEEKDNEKSISDDYFDKKEIFDNNNIFNDDDDNMIEVKPFDEKPLECNHTHNEDIQMQKESLDNPINTLSVLNNDSNGKEEKEEFEFKTIQNQLNNKSNEDEAINEDNGVATFDSKVIISLKGFENFDITKNEFFNAYQNMNINDEYNEANNELYDENNNLDVLETPNEIRSSDKVKIKLEHNKDKKKDGLREKKKKNLIKIGQQSNSNISKKNNKIIEDDDEREYVCFNETKEKDKPSIKAYSPTNHNVHSISNIAKPNDFNNKHNRDKQAKASSLNKQPPSRSSSTSKPQQQKTFNPKPTNQSEVTHSHHYHHHHHNSNINNITVINNTIIPPSSTNNTLQIPQTPIINNEIKKKEYDILCLSLLNTTLSKMKTKLLASNDKTASSSSITLHFDDMINMTNQLRKEDSSKRIQSIIDKTMKLLISIFEVFENEAKREQYIQDVLQILGVIDNFHHKAQDALGEKMPQSFKTIKLVFKYIYCLFKMKGYTTNYLKNLIEQEETNNKTKNLMKFTKTFKSFNNSVDKLKKLLAKDSSEDKKQKRLNEALFIYLETNPNAIKYSKCFKVGKKFIEYIFDYLTNK